MVDSHHLQAQARKCRMLASGLTNRDDIRVLEELAREYEERAKALGMVARPQSASRSVVRIV